MKGLFEQYVSIYRDIAIAIDIDTHTHTHTHFFAHNIAKYHFKN